MAEPIQIKKLDIPEPPLPKSVSFGELLFAFLDQWFWWAVITTVEGGIALHRYIKEHQVITLVWVLLFLSLLLNIGLTSTSVNATRSPLMNSCFNGTISADMTLVHEQLSSMMFKMKWMRRDIENTFIMVIVMFVVTFLMFVVNIITFIRTFKVL